MISAIYFFTNKRNQEREKAKQHCLGTGNINQQSA
jgi:hypothetical protein